MKNQFSSEQQEYFVALFDLTNFANFYKSESPTNVLKVLYEFSEISKEIVEQYGGKIIKFSNDSGLAAFPEEKTDIGVRAMIHLKKEVDLWASKRLPGSRLAMNGHVGSAAIGKLKDGSYEIVGSTVAMVYSMGRKQFVISPQSFRKLSPETRKAFKKHTPPIFYKVDSE